MSEAKDIVKLAVDTYKGHVAGNFSTQKSLKVLRQALIDANNGSTKFDYKSIRDGKCNGLFAILEEIIQKLVVEGLTGDEFFFQMVDYRNLKLGDKNEFVVPDNSLFVVSKVAEGTHNVRRQRLNGATTVTIDTEPRIIKIYEEVNRVLSGRIDFNEMIDRVSKSMSNQAKEDIYVAFKNSYSSLPATFAQSGSFSEDKLMTLVEHVEAATGQSPVIVGTKSALRKVTQAIVSDSAKEDVYGMGYYGKFNGVPMVAMKQVHKNGTYDFVLSDDDLYVFAGNDKPIKFVTEGDSVIMPNDPSSNALLQQEFVYVDRYGVGVVINQLYGIMRLSS